MRRSLITNLIFNVLVAGSTVFASAIVSAEADANVKRV